MNLFSHMFLSFPSSIRSEKELPVMKYIIQKCFIWGGQDFSDPPFTAGQGSCSSSSGTMRSCGGGGLSLVILPEES